jgi:hypothetical protein
MLVLGMAMWTTLTLSASPPAAPARAEAPLALRVDMSFGEYLSDALRSDTCGTSHRRCVAGLNLRVAFEAPLRPWLAATLDAAVQTDRSRGGLDGNPLFQPDVGLVLRWPGWPAAEPRLLVLAGPVAGSPGVGWAVHGGPGLAVFPWGDVGIALFVDGGAGRIAGRPLATVQYGISAVIRR